MKLVIKAIDQWRREWSPWDHERYPEGLDGILRRTAYYDFEDEAGLLVEALSRNSWREWLCLDYGEEDPEYTGPPPVLVECSYLHHGKLRPCLISVLRNKLTFHVEEPGQGIVAYPFCLHFRTRSAEQIYAEAAAQQPELVLEPRAREALDHTLAWLTELCYGASIWGDDEPPPLQPLFMNKHACDLFLDNEARGTPLSEYESFYGPVFRFALCAVSLLWADREEVHVSAPLRPRSYSRLHNKEHRKQELPEHRVITYTLLRKVVRDRVETGEVREARERRRCRDHAVIAHWRTLRSGRRVPVAAHRRGDKALGTVERHYVVKAPPKVNEGDDDA